MNPMDEEEEDGAEIVKMVHESRAKKRGLTWNEEKYRYEKDGKPIIFTDFRGNWRVATEAEWDALWIKHI